MGRNVVGKTPDSIQISLIFKIRPEWFINLPCSPRPRQHDTGPSSDHTGTDTTLNGYYMYVEASSPNSPYVGPFILESKLVFPDDIGSMGSLHVEFYYHM